MRGYRKAAAAHLRCPNNRTISDGRFQRILGGRASSGYGGDHSLISLSCPTACFIKMSRYPLINIVVRRSSQPVDALSHGGLSQARHCQGSKSGKRQPAQGKQRHTMTAGRLLRLCGGAAMDRLVRTQRLSGPPSGMYFFWLPVGNAASLRELVACLLLVTISTSCRSFELGLRQQGEWHRVEEMKRALELCHHGILAVGRQFEIE